MSMGPNEFKEAATGLIEPIAAILSERVETLTPKLIRWCIRLSVAWFGILSLCVLLTWCGLLMKSTAFAHTYGWLALEVAAALFIVPFIILLIVFWGFVWAARITVFCAFALRFLVRPLK
jgi:hypothetical protein